jgi:beta-lactamase regulating signal transducer with metallopeptidase domain
MHVLIGIALKSLLIAGITLGLLELMKKRSAAERSWVAHIGLLALVIMAFAPLVLPSWNVEAPALLGQTPAAETSHQAAAKNATATLAVKEAQAGSATPRVSVSTAAAATAAYAVPAAILLFITLLALGRLVALRARADVLVDGHWLSALARAQRRMGFKHGTALLTSNDLASPISWGLMRPVILLNPRAVEASDEAEAIIAHELAHVARMDWAKLLLARIATALFWFNPLVWVLAREAHQLREEAADDAVLAADITDTDYAQLLVGVARHECPGLLLGAHGVAPSKSSLARRVARVLDGTSVRGPVARSFALGVFTGAVLIAAPLAALTLTPAGDAPKKSAQKAATVAEPDTAEPYYGEGDVPTDLASLIADGVSTSVTTAVAAVAADEPALRVVSPNGSMVASANGITTARGKDGATITVYPADAQGRRRMVARAANGATAVTYVDADDLPDAIAAAEGRRGRDRTVDDAIAAKVLGITPEYVGAMRAAAPKLRSLDAEEFAGLKAVGVTPEYARDLVAAGFPSIDEDELAGARAVGLTGGYVRAMRAAGIQGSLDEFVQLRAVGIDPGFAARARKSGIRVHSADDLIGLHGVGAVKPPAPPAPPGRTGHRTASPPDWGPVDPDDG